MSCALVCLGLAAPLQADQAPALSEALGTLADSLQDFQNSQAADAQALKALEAEQAARLKAVVDALAPLQQTIAALSQTPPAPEPSGLGESLNAFLAALNAADDAELTAQTETLQMVQDALIAKLTALDPNHRGHLVAMQSAMLTGEITAASGKAPWGPDHLTALRDAIDDGLGPRLGPRVRIVHASYGDFSKDAKPHQRCNATRALRTLCDGQGRCQIRGNVAEQACGVDVAFASVPENKRLVVTYACPDISRSAWARVAAGEMALPKELYARLKLNTRDASPVISCRPTFADPAALGDPELTQALQSAVAAIQQFSGSGGDEALLAPATAEAEKLLKALQAKAPSQ